MATKPLLFKITDITLSYFWSSRPPVPIPFCCIRKKCRQQISFCVPRKVWNNTRSSEWSRFEILFIIVIIVSQKQTPFPKQALNQNEYLKSRNRIFLEHPVFKNSTAWMQGKKNKRSCGLCFICFNSTNMKSRSLRPPSITNNNNAECSVWKFKDSF